MSFLFSFIRSRGALTAANEQESAHEFEDFEQYKNKLKNFSLESDDVQLEETIPTKVSKKNDSEK